MHQIRFSVLVMLAAQSFAFCLSNATARAQWGAVQGRVVVTGDVPEVRPLHEKGDTRVKEPLCRAHVIADESLVVDPDSKGLANAFVFLYRPPDEIHPDLQDEPEDVVFDQKNCRFEPHAMVIQTGQTIVVKSGDPILHNTHTFPTFNSPQNVALQPNNREGIPFQFRQREPAPVQVKCDLHPWMVAWWLVVDHPYAAVTDEQGTFEIGKLPAGTHRFRVWQERAGWIDKSLMIDVRSDEATEVTIEVPADSLKSTS